MEIRQKIYESLMSAMPAHTSDLQTPSAYEQEEESTESEEDGQRDEVPHSVKVTRVIDDGTQSFFWRTHSVTVLICMLAVFLYVALIEEPKNDINYNTKRGILACIVAFCLFGMTQAKDGPFTRPHPAFWRLVLCLSVVYELALVYMLFQSLDDARQLMKHFDPELGEPLPERSYAEDCRFYDPEPHPDGHFHNFWEKCDVFIWGHLFGWWAKMLMVRDYWLCNVISILFEVLEYTLEHQLPNFAECWWDHWLLDAVICNGLGIWLGMKTLNYLNASTYHWRGLWSINTYSGKLKRMMMQFTPYSWTEFEWHPTESLNRWIFVILLVCFFLVAELNCFYLKFVLWIPPPHFVNFTRLILLVPVGAVAIREAYQYLNDPNCNKLGQQAWVAIAMVVTEVLIVLKFDLPLVLMVPPMSVIVCWTIFCLILLTWTIWFFFVRPYRKFKRKQMMQAQRPFSRTSKNTFYRQIKTTNQERVTKQETNPKRSVQPRTTTNGGYSTRLRSRLSNGD
ncbi:phosphatidylserine synthase 2-like isoform X1 [Apostichopus japonicus]|uniref:phosphatidylserine synthase 2-like isoform X1 n=2 Tax=Stichopus japonicus TaxID=307972 RepID=UPI003AB17C70